MKVITHLWNMVIRVGPVQAASENETGIVNVNDNVLVGVGIREVTAVLISGDGICQELAPDTLDRRARKKMDRNSDCEKADLGEGSSKHAGAKKLVIENRAVKIEVEMACRSSTSRGMATGVVTTRVEGPSSDWGPPWSR